MDEWRLLQEYAANRSEEAFKALTDQYVGLVYSACYRQLRDRHLAEDATQAVFLLLSQKAGAVHQGRLGGWLLTTSRYACANIRKSEHRRQRREQVVAMNAKTTTNAGNDLLDFLDGALCHLKSGDREALVLRYLKEEPLADIAAALGISEVAARKRVERGIGKLRGYFARHGIDSTAAGLGVVLTEQMRGAALTPAARQTIARGILQVCQGGPHATAASLAIAKGTKTMMLMTKLKVAAAVAAILAALGTGSWMISRAMAQRAPLVDAGGQTPAANSPATPNASLNDQQPATPATQPTVIDLTTPEAALNSFFRSLAAGDRDAAYQCLPVDPNRSPTLIDAMLSCDVATNHLTHAAVDTFGGDGTPVRRMVSLETIAKIFGFAPPAQINGNAATIVPTIPPQLINAMPANYQPMLRAWSSAKLHLVKEGDSWKFDIDHSMRVALKLRSATGLITDPAVKLGLLTDEAMLFQQIANEIRGGQFDTIDATSGALNAGLSRIDSKYGIVSMQGTVMPPK